LLEGLRDLCEYVISIRERNISEEASFFTFVFFRSFSPPLPSAETGMANPRHREKEEEESETVLRVAPTP
jgi:hypothetical protein